jgi:hypothetical protein
VSPATKAAPTVRAVEPSARDPLGTSPGDGTATPIAELAAGATGIQVGTLFAFARESGMAPRGSPHPLTWVGPRLPSGQPRR